MDNIGYTVKKIFKSLGTFVLFIFYTVFGITLFCCLPLMHTCVWSASVYSPFTHYLTIDKIESLAYLCQSHFWSIMVRGFFFVCLTPKFEFVYCVKVGNVIPTLGSSFPDCNTEQDFG